MLNFSIYYYLLHGSDNSLQAETICLIGDRLCAAIISQTGPITVAARDQPTDQTSSAFFTRL